MLNSRPHKNKQLLKPHWGGLTNFSGAKEFGVYFGRPWQERADHHGWDILLQSAMEGQVHPSSSNCRSLSIQLTWYLVYRDLGRSHYQSLPVCVFKQSGQIV